MFETAELDQKVGKKEYEERSTELRAGLLEAQVRIGMVFHNGQPPLPAKRHQRVPPPGAHGHSGRVLKRRDGVEQLGAHPRFFQVVQALGQGIGVQAVFIQVHGNQTHLVGAKNV